MRLRYGLCIVLLALCVMPQKLVAQTISVRNTNWFFSPYNWYTPGLFSISGPTIGGGGIGNAGLTSPVLGGSSGGGLSALVLPNTSSETVTNQPGAYFTLSFTNSSLAILNLDTLTMPASGITTSVVVQWSVDGIPSGLHTITRADGQLILASGLGGGTHTIQFWVVSSDYHLDRWTKNVALQNGFLGPAQSLRITGLTLDSGGSLVAPVGVHPKRILFFGDSITEGAAMTPADDATQTYAIKCAQLLNAEVGIVAHPGQGWACNIAPTTGVPNFSTAFAYYYGQTPRFPLQAPPDYILINMGTNDGIAGSLPTQVAANTVAWLQQVRNYLPNTQIYVIVPFGGFEAAPLQSAVNQYLQAHPTEKKLGLINLGPTAQTGLMGLVAGGSLQSVDGIHPNVATHQQLGYQLTAALQTARGANDLNGDGKSDLILQNVTTNQIGSWFQNGLLNLGSALIGSIPALPWQIVGSADFNGDGKPDYVFQNQVTNQIALWYMDGSTQLSSAVIGGVPAGGFTVVGTGDINGDGKPDIIFQNQVTNQVAFWFMDGATVLGGSTLSFLPGVGYKVVGIADFNRDGQADLLFQNSLSGALVIWYMGGAQYKAGATVSSVPPLGYRVEAVADFDGDGRPDVVLRDTLGNVVIWHLDDAKVYSAETISSRLDLSYRIVGPR